MAKLNVVLMGMAIGVALTLGACREEAANANSSALEGTVEGDGSSTVAPIVRGLVEKYAEVEPGVQVTMGISGTRGGFENFIASETDFSNASRPIQKEEAQRLEEAGIDYTESTIAYDGVTVSISRENDFVDNLTVEQLKQLWTEDGTIKKWSDINPEWPDDEVIFYSPGIDSGTYDYFNEVILEGANIVQSATLSEDDNTLVQGVQADPNAIGYFGYSYYLANKDTLRAVRIDGVEPTNETIASGDYTPLSRPLFIYSNNEALQNDPAVYDFMKFALENGGELAETVGYAALPAEKYTKELNELKAAANNE